MPAERRGAITGASHTNSSSTTSTIGSANTNNNNNNNNMSAFSFGSTPAPAPPAFGAPAPAPSGGFGFGATPAPAAGGFGAPAPAPSAGGFSLGPGPQPAPAAPAPGGLFGTPAPAPGGLFGTPAAAPPATGVFGTPSTTSLFGAPAPAPGGSLFGAPAPAPGGSLFGAPTPAPGGMFGAAPLGAAPAAPPPALAGHMKYSELPPDQKQAIDRLYQAMMQHKRTVLQVSTMAPKLLDKNTQQADAAAGQDVPLGTTVRHLNMQVQQLHQMLASLREGSEHTKALYERSTTQAYMYAKWPTEAVAKRRGASLTKPKAGTTDADMQGKLQALLDQEMVHVDRVERMPSPYLWQVLAEVEQRLGNLKREMEYFKKALEQSKQIKPSDANVIEIVQQQEMAITKVANGIVVIHGRVDELRHAYRRYEKGTNVLDEADQREVERKKLLDHKLKLQMVKTLPAQAAPTGAAPAPGGMFGTTPAPSSGGLFGAPSPSLFGAAPAPAGGLFGSTPAPAPSTGLFGSTPAPAPAGGGLFGSTPAPAPAGGGLFGATPAPAPTGGGIFGAPAPPAFGAAPAPAFGATPAPAPAGAGIFGAPAPPAFGAAPAPVAGGGLFPSTASSSSSTPKSKNKSRGSRRR